MNIQLLQKHIGQYVKGLDSNPDERHNDAQERAERRAYYQSWSADRIKGMSEEEFGAYVSKLWAMLIWGNKKYIVNKLIEDNGFDSLRNELAEFVWGSNPVDQRWDHFRNNVKGLGPASMSEILCHSHPDDCMLWNRRAYVALRYLGVENLPKHDYQVNGKRYVELSSVASQAADEMRKAGVKDVDLLTVDYFIWDQLQVEDNLSQIHQKSTSTDPQPESFDKVKPEAAEFIHDEIKNKIADIGKWLGFDSDTEIKVADGSRVDAVWEATIGNMGRIVYVFEVQTKGSIDGLIVNLLKSLNNPAVQGVVAVSDSSQLDKIKKLAAGLHGFGEKLKFWNYEKVLQVHESLESVNETINSLGLVPQGF